MKLNFGGIVEVSTVDWYGRSAMVIFFNGCPLRCIYCQNYKLLDAENFVNIEDVEKKILDAKSLVSAVVFSGGEPAMQFEALKRLARFAKEQGLLVGIETNGYYPGRLKQLIDKKLVDKIFIDIKAPLDDDKKYHAITGRQDASRRVRRSLNLRANIEARTTVFRSFADVEEIAKSLKNRDYTYVIQQGVPENAPEGKIREEKPLTRDEITALAQSVLFLKDVRVRTREKGEERIK